MARAFNVYIACVLTAISMETNGQGLSKNSVVRFLALGDSYTIGESVAEGQRWPVQLADALAKEGYRLQEPEIIAVTGWRTDNLKKSIITQNLSRDYDLVSLLIGVNNQYQGKSVAEYEEEFDELLDLAIGLAGNDQSKVFVLSIPDYGFTPFGKERQAEISKHIDSFNAANKNSALRKGVTYIDITDISRKGLNDPELVAEDGLHPSGSMYGLWVRRILEKLQHERKKK